MPSKSPCVNTRLARLAFTSNFKGLTPLVIFLFSDLVLRPGMITHRPISLRNGFLGLGQVTDLNGAYVTRRSLATIRGTESVAIISCHDTHFALVLAPGQSGEAGEASR
jgi:hypothetical protein